MSEGGILACYAHPDDEQGVTGILRLCIEQGIHATLVCATRGEVGQISDPTLATPETLGQVREGELRRAASVIGLSDVRFLGYRDSGMAGTPPNADPRAFINADPVEAIGRIVHIMRAVRPRIVVTFDESGAYGHPDHLAICKWTTEAFHAAGRAELYPEAGQPFAPSRLYYASIPRSTIRLMQTVMRSMNIESVFATLDAEQMGLADERITHRADVSPYVDLKLASMSEHRTQIDPRGPFAQIPMEAMREFRRVEHFALVAGTPTPPGADAADLFAGLQ